MDVFVYDVINAEATQLETTLNNLFSSSGQGATNRNTGATQRGGGTPGGFGGGGPGGGFAGRGGFGGGGAGGGGRGGVGGGGGDAGDLVDNVFVVAEEDTNTLLVMTSPENFDIVRGIIEELDKPVPQVLIKVLIAEVTHSDDLDYGVEYSVLNLGSRPDTVAGTSFGISEANVLPNSGLIMSYLTGDVDITVRALQTISDLDVLSRPYILSSDNQESTITVGAEVPFIRNTRISDNGQVTNDVEYDDVGIILTVTPQIGPDGLVVLDIAPEISSISGETVQVSDTVEAPVIEKRSANTRVAIQDGQTIVIGGLMGDTLTKAVNQVPILGDIPWIGELFKRTENKTSKTELLFFLTPHVAENSKELAMISSEEEDGLTIVKDSVGPGKFDEQMKGMKRGSFFKFEGVENPSESEGMEGSGNSVLDLDSVDIQPPAESEPVFRGDEGAELTRPTMRGKSIPARREQPAPVAQPTAEEDAARMLREAQMKTMMDKKKAEAQAERERILAEELRTAEAKAVEDKRQVEGSAAEEAQAAAEAKAAEERRVTEREAAEELRKAQEEKDARKYFPD
jgi:type II secretory pathway component GspD/PulD (secretin)